MARVKLTGEEMERLAEAVRITWEEVAMDLLMAAPKKVMTRAAVIDVVTDLAYGGAIDHALSAEQTAALVKFRRMSNTARSRFMREVFTSKFYCI